jgi:hypothetical protein
MSRLVWLPEAPVCCAIGLAALCFVAIAYTYNNDRVVAVLPNERWLAELVRAELVWFGSDVAAM